MDRASAKKAAFDISICRDIFPVTVHNPAPDYYVPYSEKNLSKEDYETRTDVKVDNNYYFSVKKGKICKTLQ